MDLRAAWEHDGVTSVISGHGFDSPIFTILTGPEEKIFSAHATYLYQSPVFRTACEEQIRVRDHTYGLKLPDKDPNVMAALLQYLYTGDFLDFGTMESGAGPAGAGAQLADMYSAAHDYELPNLKILVLRKLEVIIDAEERPDEFLSIMKAIYAKVNDAEEEYREFFRQCAVQLPKPVAMLREMRSLFSSCISSGGILAIDLVDAICMSYNAQRKSWTAEAPTPTSSETSLDWGECKASPSKRIMNTRDYKTVMGKVGGDITKVDQGAGGQEGKEHKERKKCDK
ncbi:MAG: hypothetical protein Q9182_005690 [Xanthomendoza sp. 2 TL-2023]